MTKPSTPSESVTYILPTIGRPSLARTLASIEARNDDEILIVCDATTRRGIAHYADRIPQIRFIECSRGGDWGHRERNHALPLARGRYIAQIDDDDIFVPGTRDLMADAMASGQPTLFRMRFPNGITLWQERIVRCGNVGTPMMFFPNVAAKFGTFGSFVGGDCAFLETSGWTEFVWRPEIIALLGHNI